MTASLVELVEDGALAEAREWVVALWRRKPHASLAALASELDALSGAPSPARAALDRIITGGNSVSSRERLQELFATLDHDPGVFEWMVGTLASPQFDVATGNPRRLYEAIIDEMAKLEDERVAPWVAELPAFLQAHKGRRFAQLSPDEIAALTEIFGARTFSRAVAVPLTADEDAAIAAARLPLDKLKERARARGEQRARLFEHVCANFDDDLAKQVVADHLLEEGDPLGEYIVLSLKLAHEGALPDDLAKRHGELEAHARSFQPMGFRFERGFAVEARFTNGDGTRRGSYDVDPRWGTIEVSDVPPTNDACATASLRELYLRSTSIADLAKLKKPLAVTKLRWSMASQAGRPKWKKVSVLPALEVLDLGSPGEGSFAWALHEGPGPNVRDLTIEAWSWGRHVSWLMEAWAKAPALARVRLGPHLVFTRGGSELKLAISVPDAKILEKVQSELADATRPLVDEVIVSGPSEANVYAGLLALGRKSRASFTSSPAADAATVRRADDTLTIAPAAAHDVFDVPALRAVLAMKKEAARHILITSSVLTEQAGDYFRVAREEAGATALTLQTRWRTAPFTMRIEADALDVDIGRFDQVSLVVGAMPSFGGRVKKIIVRHAPGIRNFGQAVAPLRALTDELELVEEERVLATMFAYSSVKGRAAIQPMGTSARLSPSTADLILADKPRPKELRVGQSSFDVAAWIDWVARTKLSVTFAYDWRVAALSKLSWDDGIVAKLHVDGQWSDLVTSLANTADRAIGHLELRSRIPPPADAIAECKRVAQKLEIVA